MTALHRLFSTLRRWIRPAREERQLDDELRSFVEMSTAQRIREGGTPAEARRGRAARDWRPRAGQGTGPRRSRRRLARPSRS